MYLFEGYCQDGSIQVAGPESETIQSAADSFAGVWNELCGGVGELPNPIDWTGDGSSNFASTNVPFGWFVDVSGTSIPPTGQSTNWTIPDPLQSDQSLSFLAACGLVICYGLGLIGGQQR